MRENTINTPLGDNHNANFSQQLNRQQYEAVKTTNGPVLVIAGAGSGKTRTLVYRVAYLVQQGVVPERILLLSFTRRASHEMLWRAGQLLNASCSGVVGGTFHSIANMVLRSYAKDLGFSSAFTIIDRADAEGIVNLLKSSLGFSRKDKQFPSKRVLINMMSGSVNKSRELEDIVLGQYSHLRYHVNDIVTLKEHYTNFKTDHGLMDYDDLLINWQRLLEEFPEARRQISSRFSHIMVDEYQDTNRIQANIVRLMARGHENVMVVGDDSQSIYSFRGADFHNIMRFPEIFKGTKIIKLEENYRSTQPILSLTNDIIRNSTEKYSKTLFSRIEGGVIPKLYGGFDEKAEAAFVAGKINELITEGVALKDIAVLFRSSFHSYKLEVELRTYGYDFEKRGGLKLTESAHIKDILSFMRIVTNSHDTLSWNRVLLQLDKVGPKTAQKITATIAENEDPIAALAKYPVRPAWQGGVNKLVELFGRLFEPEMSPGELFELIMEYYTPLFQQIYRDDYPKRQKDLEQFKSVLSSYGDLQTCLDEMTLEPPESAIESECVDNRLILSTIHSAKGLEWDVVFVIGLADGRFPHAAADIGDQWEEERRLFYVAATRAKKRLYLCHPKEIMGVERRFKRVGVSPLIAELKTGVYQVEVESKSLASQVQHFEKRSPALRQSRQRQKLSIDDICVGCRVDHPFFGSGSVKKLSMPKTVDIQFDRYGLKTLHLDYAKLEIVNP